MFGDNKLWQHEVNSICSQHIHIQKINKVVNSTQHTIVTLNMLVKLTLQQCNL